MALNGISGAHVGAHEAFDTDHTDGTSITAALGSLSASGTSAAVGMLEQIANGGTVDAASAAMLRLVAQNLGTLRELIAAPHGANITQLQQVIARTHQLDQNQQILERAAVAALNELLSYQRDAPRSGPIDAHVALDARALRAWGEMALNVSTAFEDLALRCQAQADLLEQPA